MKPLLKLTNLSKIYPSGEEKQWEDADAIRVRVLRVLEKYAHDSQVIVACHGMMIQAVTGKEHPECGEIVPFDLAEE